MHRQDDAHAKLCEGGCTQNGCIDGIIQAICRAMDAHKNECTDRMMHRYIDAQTEGRTDTYTEWWIIYIIQIYNWLLWTK